MYDGNPKPEPGAIVCRVAESFLRFGSFEIHSAMGDYETLRRLVDFTLLNHFEGHDPRSDEGLVHWLNRVAETTAAMIAHWERVGFVHGVMNTDNMSIHGITIDYGPFGWVEDYDPNWTPQHNRLEYKEVHVRKPASCRRVEFRAPFGGRQPALRGALESLQVAGTLQDVLQESH